MRNNLETLLSMMYVGGECIMSLPSIKKNIQEMVAGAFPDTVPQKWQTILRVVKDADEARIESLIWNLYLAECGLGPLPGFGLLTLYGDPTAGDPERQSIYRIVKGERDGETA